MKERLYIIDKDFDMDITPKWMKITLMICTWFLYITPFTICSIAMFFTDNMSLSENYLWTAVYILSIIKLWDLVNLK